MAYLRFQFVSVALIVAVFSMAEATAGPLSPRRHVTVDLVADRDTVVPGEKLTLAVREQIEPGWHTYWTNPGDSGEPTAIDWTLPDGVTAGAILWPIPHTIPIGPLVNYGYENELVLLTEAKIPESAPKGNLTIAGRVRYLVCKDICVPEEAQVSLNVIAGEGGAPSASASLIENVRKTLPLPLPGQATYSTGSLDTLRLAANFPPAELKGVTDARFFPAAWGPVSNSAPQQVHIGDGVVVLDLKQGDTKETPPALEGVLVLSAGKDLAARKGFTLAAAKTASAAALPAAVPGAGAPDGAANGGIAAGSGGTSIGGVAFAALFAFLGGLILNLMPCVFPVLALKALSFSKPRTGGHGSQGTAYLAGVLVSFGIFGIIIALFRQSTAALGWGFQFQSPEFVLILAVLFFVMGLSLSGAVSFGSSLMSAGDSLARKPGLSGYFFTGVLAAIAATPCTAPFMGAAVGYAMTQPAPVLLIILLFLGLGFALPVFGLSLIPSMQRVLPKPGAWMETLKQVLAFPLYATAAWLVWVLSLQAGSDGVMAAALALIGVAFAAWLADKTAFSALAIKAIAPAIGIAALIFALSFIGNAMPGAPAAGIAEGGTLKEEPYTKARLETLQSEGRPVFVNLTAAWCITCKVNERIALKSSAIAKAFQARGIVYLKGDWTRQNPEIGALLQKFGRAGVPLYIFYPPDGGEPRVLPQLLTEGLVLDEIKTQSAVSPVPTAKGA